MEKMRFWITLAVTTLTAAAVLSICPARGEGDIYRDVLRLRVVAASDSAEDQEDKLAVRDEVLALLGGALEACGSREEAEELAVDMEEEIAACASSCLLKRGKAETVRVSVGWERSPRRDYGEAVLPAGTYRTLKVVIGEGDGKNWWCVLFPGICMRTAEKGEESIAAGLTPEEYRIITKSGEGRFRVKLWILEKLEELTDGREKESGGQRRFG